MARENLKSVARLLEELNKDIPVNEKFVKDLKRSIELNEKKNTRKPSQSFKPSSMNCLRNMYYQVIGVEPEESSSSASLIGICQSGSDIHNWIQSAISKMNENGIDCEYVDVAQFIKDRQLNDVIVIGKQGNETKLYNKKYNISFLADGIIRYENKYYILEIKSETSSKWIQRLGVDSKHYNQATTYSLSLRLDDAIFLYVNRDILDIKGYLFHVDDKMRNNVVNRILNVGKCIELKTVPQKEESRGCQYCAYKHQCKKDL